MLAGKLERLKTAKHAKETAQRSYGKEGYALNAGKTGRPASTGGDTRRRGGYATGDRTQPNAHRENAVRRCGEEAEKFQ